MINFVIKPISGKSLIIQPVACVAALPSQGDIFQTAAVQCTMENLTEEIIENLLALVVESTLNVQSFSRFALKLRRSVSSTGSLSLVTQNNLTLSRSNRLAIREEMIKSMINSPTHLKPVYGCTKARNYMSTVIASSLTTRNVGQGD